MLGAVDPCRALPMLWCKGGFLLGISGPDDAERASGCNRSYAQGCTFTQEHFFVGRGFASLLL